MAWTPVPLPTLPRPHSSVAVHDPKLLSARLYTWGECCGGPRRPRDDIVDGFLVRGGQEHQQLVESIVPHLREAWGTTGDSLVALQAGTVIDVRNWGILPDFQGFARHGSTYAIPIHRFPAASDRERLGIAAAVLEACEHAHQDPACDPAFSVLESAGYPRAGMAEADASVVGLWTNGASLCAVCECQAQSDARTTNARICTLVFLPPQVLPLGRHILKDIADAGRDQFRLDFLSPRVAVRWQGEDIVARCQAQTT